MKKKKLRGGGLHVEITPENNTEDKKVIRDEQKNMLDVLYGDDRKTQQIILEEWKNDDDPDDSVEEFVGNYEIANENASCTQVFSQEIDSSAGLFKVNYNIINNLQILKEKLVDLLTIKNYDSLKEFFEKHKMYYFQYLLEYLLEDYDSCDRSRNFVMVIFRKILKLSICGMKRLRETINSIKEAKDFVHDKNPLYRVWRREDQEKSMHKEIDYVTITDNFLSTTTSLNKAIEFFTNQSIANNCIIWKIIFEEKQHANSFIIGGDLEEVIFDVGSILTLKKTEEIVSKPNYTLKTFLYQGSSDDIKSIFDKYDKIIPTMDLVVAIIELEDAINSTGLDIPLLDKKIKDLIKKRERYTRHGLELSDDVLQNVEKLILEARKKLSSTQQDGGRGKICKKKEIMGKLRCIYKKPNDRKEYVKYKGELVTIKEIRKIINTNKKTKKTPKASKKT